MDTDKLYELTSEDIHSLVKNNKKNWDHYGLPVIEIDDEEIAVALTEDDADAAVADAIKSSLAYFGSDFLANKTGLPVVFFQSLQKHDFDDSEAMCRLVEATCGLDDLIDDACCIDGRGHFLSSYDGSEHEVDGCFLYII